jgi:hypothetical protein
MSGQAPLQVRDLEPWCGLLASAHNGLSLLDATKPQGALFATVFVLGYPLPCYRGRCICDGSLSSPIAWLSRTLGGKPPQEA